jgi:hypothetical protein
MSRAGYLCYFCDAMKEARMERSCHHVQRSEHGCTSHLLASLLPCRLKRHSLVGDLPTSYRISQTNPFGASAGVKPDFARMSWMHNLATLHVMTASLHLGQYAQSQYEAILRHRFTFANTIVQSHRPLPEKNQRPPQRPHRLRKAGRQAPTVALQGNETDLQCRDGSDRSTRVL